MAGEINRVPRALLSILDMKARGQNPRQLDENLQGAVELLPFYLQETRRDISVAFTISAIGYYSSAALIVPQTQLWYVHGLYATGVLGLAAGTTQAGVPAVESPGTPVRRKSLGDVARYTAAQVPFHCAFQVPYLLPPGGSCGWYCTELVLGVAYSLAVTADVSILEL